MKSNKIKPFNLGIDTPKLVDHKIVRKFKKRKIKKMKTNLKFLKNFKEFFVDNSFIIIVISLIVLILCFRYKEAQNKRKKTNI